MENEIIIQEKKEELHPVAIMPEMKGISMWADVASFEAAQRMAMLLAKSDIVPQNYKGKVADCVVAIDIANRMGLPPISVMQSSQVVYGNFSWKGSACKAMIDNCGKYKNTRYVEVGERGEDSWGYYLEATTQNDEIIKGVTVTMKMAKDEKWYEKNGSKWKTMPELMLKYRCAAFFMRTECSGLSMGFLTVEEREDIADNRISNEDFTAMLDTINE